VGKRGSRLSGWRVFGERDGIAVINRHSRYEPGRAWRREFGRQVTLEQQTHCDTALAVDCVLFLMYSNGECTTDFVLDDSAERHVSYAQRWIS